MIDCYINNESMNSIGVYLPTRPCIPANSKEIEYIPIYGRDGDLTVFKGWKDRPFNLDFNFVDYTNLQRKIREIRAILLNAKTIMFSEDLDVYYKIKNVEITDISRQLEMFGYFTVSFLLAPFDYSTSTDKIILTSNTNILNLGTHISNPKIKIYGSGNLQISINSQTFQVNNVINYAEIDSEILLCYEGATNKELINGWPILEVGNNEVVISSNITKVEIEPRWRYL